MERLEEALRGAREQYALIKQRNMEELRRLHLEREQVGVWRLEGRRGVSCVGKSWCVGPGGRLKGKQGGVTWGREVLSLGRPRAGCPRGSTIH